MVAAASAPDKRTELVRAAMVLLHEQGLQQTTLAHVAARARVPLGNVYYYFKTKDALVDAVAAARLDEVRSLLEWAGTRPSPTERLCAVIEAFIAHADEIVALGCPYGALVTDLERGEAKDGQRGESLFAVQLAWFESQLKQRRTPRARARAFELLSAIQGACLVAHGLRDTSLYRRRLTDLARELRRESSKGKS